jgi:thiazole synthase ThiGH ThiG subunit
MPGAVPRCVPVEMKRNRHGDHALTEVVGTERVQVSGRWRTVEVRACPVRFSPDSRQIEAARCTYDDWWQALGWVRDGLIAGSMLREMEVTAAMPKVRPWRG